MATRTQRSLKRRLWKEEGDGAADHSVTISDEAWLYSKQFVTKGNIKIIFVAGSKEDGLSSAKTSNKQVSDYILKKRYSSLWPSLSKHFFLLKSNNELRKQSPDTKTIFDLETAVELFGSSTERAKLVKKLKTAAQELTSMWNAKQKLDGHSQFGTSTAQRFDVSIMLSIPNSHCKNYNTL